MEPGKCLDNHSVNSLNLNKCDIDDSPKSTVLETSSPWQLTLTETYHIAVKFFKENDGKAVHLTYNDKLRLVALILQVKHGKFRSEKASPLGYLDVIGKDRRIAWQMLGDISQEQAMSSFITELTKLCALFKPYLEAHQKSLEEKVHKLEEEHLVAAEKQMLKEAEHRKALERNQTEKQKRQIQDMLNQQTFSQFKEYAEKQYPGNPDEMQEQHYQQYMQQIYMQQLQHQESHFKTSVDENPIIENNSSEEEISGEPQFAEPSMWTNKNIVEFKDAISNEGGDGVIRVGHGETLTVRVPTHPEGNALYWEFATDNFDIGFGVYFEWSLSPGDRVTVHISESEADEEEGEEEEEEDTKDSGR